MLLTAERRDVMTKFTRFLRLESQFDERYFLDRRSEVREGIEMLGSLSYSGSTRPTSPGRIRVIQYWSAGILECLRFKLGDTVRSRDE